MKYINRHLAIHHLWAAVITAGVFIFVNTHPIRPHDFWWHMAVGREILATRQIPEVDTYSFTANGVPYPSYHSFWLADIMIYLIYQTGGPALVVFFQSVVITSAYVLILVICIKQTRNWRIGAFGCAFAAVLGMNDWNVRPQAITIFLGALFLFLIQLWRIGGRRGLAVLFPILMVVWVNSHGSFPMGLLILGLWLGQEAWDWAQTRMVKQTNVHPSQMLMPGLIFVTSSLACLINPTGFGILEYQQRLWGNQAIKFMVVEWAAPTFETLGGSLFLGALLLTAIVFASSPRRATLFQVVGFLATAILALRTSRGIVWFGLVVAPIIVDHINAIWQRLTADVKPKEINSGSPVVNKLFLGLIITAVVITLPWFKEFIPLPAAKAGLISTETPVQATEYILETHPPENIFHAMSFGSYLIWKAQPEYRVFVDGRVELYNLGIWMDYLLISQAMADWQGKLDRYGVHTLLLSRSEQEGLVNAVSQSDNWELIFEDEAALVFVAR